MGKRCTAGVLIKFAVSGFLLGCLFLSGCNKDKPTLSFEIPGSALEVAESTTNNEMSIRGPALLLSEPAHRDIAVYIELDGTATKTLDYVLPDPIIIPKGTTRFPLSIQLVNDKEDELDETVTLTITGASNGSANLGTSLTYDFIIKDDDTSEMSIGLYWGTSGGFSNDMDLYLWKEVTPGSGTFEIVSSRATRLSGSGYETIHLSSQEPDGLYGLSYVYYSGGDNYVLFTVSMAPIGEAKVEGSKEPKQFEALYGVQNINSGEVTVREQYFTKKGSDFKNISTIVVPNSGS